MATLTHLVHGHHSDSSFSRIPDGDVQFAVDMPYAFPHQNVYLRQQQPKNQGTRADMHPLVSDMGGYGDMESRASGGAPPQWLTGRVDNLGTRQQQPMPNSMMMMEQPQQPQRPRAPAFTAALDSLVPQAELQGLVASVVRSMFIGVNFGSLFVIGSLWQNLLSDMLVRLPVVGSSPSNSLVHVLAATIVLTVLVTLLQAHVDPRFSIGAHSHDP